MPSPKHPCAHTGCKNMVVRKNATHCRNHVIHTPEWVEKIAAKNRGRQLSPETRLKISIAHTGSGEITRTCPVCNELFTVEKPSSKVRFCSRQCGYIQRQGNKSKSWNADMPTINCRVCGKPFRLPAKSLLGKRFTCSYTCKNVWQRNHQQNKGTNIEIAMEKALKAEGINYIPQHGLCNITVVDFYLPELNTAIFCDGDYWHSLPDKIKRDSRQSLVLQESGYTVHRFKGSEILSNVDSCIDKIKRMSTCGT